MVPYPLARRGLAQLVAVVAIVGASLLAVAGVRDRLAARVEEQQIVIDARQASIARLPPFEDDEIAALTAKRDRITGQLRVFDKLDRGRRGVAPALDAAIRGHMLPPGPGDSHKLWVTSYREGGGHVSLKGYAIDNADISERMRELQKDPRFSEVQMCFTKCPESDRDLLWYPFEVGMKVDYTL